MEGLYDFLAGRLNGVKKLAVLGAGSLLRADDGAGIMVVKNLKSAFGRRGASRLRFYEGETAPENFSGEIKRFCPTHLLLIDAADAGEAPGSIMDIRPEDVGGITFCTHMLPLRVMTDYLERETGARVTLIGIQYGSIKFCAEVTPEIREAVEELSQALHKVICERLPGFS